ncbi:uncharacterized protein LOC62_04G006415 [Vanrija pseudolonga]|uniref:Uncharacterized protein n=1 Tax=Vanrija pseudolonga TaxID=143232 RepID=A0AAF1BM27_9TREE|nr:hypothetical protein LOC62_04G006415 [Vanrija pseudolonga]
MVSEQRYLEASHVHIQAYGYNPSSPTWDSTPVPRRAAFAPLKAMVDEAPLTLDGVSIAVRQMPTSREAELSGFAVIKEIPGVGVTINGYTVPHIAMPIVLERIHACALSAVNLSFTPSPVSLRQVMLGLLRPAFPLRSVRLSIPLSPGEVPALCDFLRTRARGLEQLELNGGLLAADDIGAIAVALHANGTITRLDLFDSGALTRLQWIKVLRRAQDRGRIAVEARQFAKYAPGSGSEEISAALAEWAISGGFVWAHEYAPV